MAWGNQKTRYGRILLEHLLVTKPRRPAVLARNLNIVGNPIYKISPTFHWIMKEICVLVSQMELKHTEVRITFKLASAFLYEATLCLLYHQGQCLWQTGTPSLCKEDSPLEKPPSHLGPHTATESHATLWGFTQHTSPTLVFVKCGRPIQRGVFSILQMCFRQKQSSQFTQALSFRLLWNY